MQLLGTWRLGNAAAGARLFERHYDSVARFFSTKVCDGHEDLIQATFLACLEALEGFRGDASFRTLLFAIARHKLFRHIRTRGRDTKYLRRLNSELRQSAPSWGAWLTSRVRQRQLLLALQDLPLDTQLMLELFYWEELPVKEIALVVELPVNTVKTRMRRGRLQLAAQLSAMSSPETDQLSIGPQQLHDNFERWAREVKHIRLEVLAP